MKMKSCKACGVDIITGWRCIDCFGKNPNLSEKDFNKRKYRTSGLTVDDISGLTFDTADRIVGTSGDLDTAGGTRDIRWDPWTVSGGTFNSSGTATNIATGAAIVTRTQDPKYGNPCATDQTSRFSRSRFFNRGTG